MNLRRLLPIVLALSLLTLVVGVAQACPGCKDALAENDPNGSGVARGFYWSILFMMAAPYSLLMIFGGYMYLKVRKARAATAAQQIASRGLPNRQATSALPPATKPEMVEV